MAAAAAPASAPGPESPALERTRGWLWFLGLCLVLAAVLRFSFPNDIEYKNDERYMVAALQRYRQSSLIPAVGMGSSAGIPNPGLSVWMFLFLGQLFHAGGPVGLARAVAVLNMTALLILAIMARTAVPIADRQVWSWTTALFSVNTFSVLFARDIWAQCVAPFFAVLLILAWFHRNRPLGAFFCGLLMAAIGQIHMAGFFFSAALLLWSVLFERFRRAPKRVPWLCLAAGLALGTLPLIPWLPYMGGNGASLLGTGGWSGLLPTRYWYEWLRTSLGLGLDYSLGRKQFLDFLRLPVIAGQATYAVLALQVVTVAVIASLTILLLRSRRLLPLLTDSSETAFLESAGLWGAGLLFTFAAIPLYTHYLLVMYPLPWIWIARLGTATGYKGRVGLAIIWSSQLLLSALFLYYIHVHHGAVHGDYGLSYGYQPH